MNFIDHTSTRSFGQASRANRFPHRWASAAAFGIALAFAGQAFGAAPPANAVIGNQASATYTDSTGLTRSATSNLVETTVRQVGSLSLVQDNIKLAAVGNTVYMPHTLTNTGNGADSFVLSTADIAAATDTDYATNIAIYADANGDGLPDSTTPLCAGLGCTTTTPSLPAGGSYGFVVALSVPPTGTAGLSDQIVVSATGSTPALYDGNNNGVFGESGDNVTSNTDTVTITGGPAFQVTKSISSSQGPTGAVLTYTLTYTNIGASAGNVALEDVVGSGATVGFAYVPGSAIWSSGASALTDAYVVGTPDATVGASDMHYQATIAGALGTLRATVTNVAPNVTGTVSFRVNVLPTATVGTSSTTNTTRFGIDADSDPTNNTLTQASNPSPYTVQQSFALVLNDGTAAAADGSNTRPASTDTDATANADLSYIASASAGQTLSYNATVWNQGNASDNFNVTSAMLAGGAGYGTWPAGTTIQLFKSDGATPLTDSSGDGITDTGPLAAGASTVVVVKITLPPNACDGGCPTGPFDASVTAQSTTNPATSNTTFERLGALAAPVLDLANATGAVDTAVNQHAVGATPTVTQSVTPGTAAVFDLFVRNEGGTADTYGLNYSGTNAFAPATSLPAGWTVQFRTAVGGVCSATGGSVISSVGPVAAGAETKVCAIVSAPVGALAGNTEVYFQAFSTVSGASDVVWDRVTVAEVNGLTIQPSHSGQIYPGGTVVYPYTLTNTGNTSCGSTFTFTMSQTLAAQGWTFVLYRDNNADGLIDGGDTVVDPAAGLTGTTLAPGANARLLVRVFAPAGAAVGTTDVVSITANSTCGTAATTSSTATGTTTVITGQVRMVKQQAIDHDCDGVPSLRGGGASVFTNTNLQVYPGECVVYRITATNEGTGNVTALTISDALPVYTRFDFGPTCSLGTASYTAPTFACAGISLAPALSATMEFRVKVDQ